MSAARYLLPLSLVAAIGACATTPIDDRKQDFRLGEGDEIKLGEQVFKEVFAPQTLLNDVQTVGMVVRVAKRIATATANAR